MFSSMKNILLLCTGLALASCSEISTDPAPARPTRTQTVSLTYSLSAPGLATDTVLVNPKLTVYVIAPTPQSDGSVNYSSTVTTATPVATLTPTLTSQTAVVGSIVVADGQPAPIVRLVFSSDNLPGRRLAASATPGAQRINAALLVNTTTPRTTVTYSGLDFARRTAAPAAPFRKQTDLGVAIY